MMNDLIENAPASAIDQSIETAEEIYSKEDETTDISSEFLKKWFFQLDDNFYFFIYHKLTLNVVQG